MIKDKRTNKKYKIPDIGPSPYYEMSSWPKADIYVSAKEPEMEAYDGFGGLPNPWSLSFNIS